MVRKFPGRYEEERKKLEGFSELCRSLLEANNFQVYDLCEQYEGIQQTLGTFNLHIGETVNDKVFRTLQVLVEEKNKADFFMNLPKKDIDDLKEKLNDEEGGVITYDDMVVAEGVVAFLQCLFRKQENMERFISEVMA